MKLIITLILVLSFAIGCSQENTNSQVFEIDEETKKMLQQEFIENLENERKLEEEAYAQALNDKRKAEEEAYNQALNDKRKAEEEEYQKKLISQRNTESSRLASSLQGTLDKYKNEPGIAEIKKIIDNSVNNVNDDNYTPLMIATVNNSNIAVIKSLIEAGANVNIISLTLIKRVCGRRTLLL